MTLADFRADAELGTSPESRVSLGLVVLTQAKQPWDSSHCTAVLLPILLCPCHLCPHPTTLSPEAPCPELSEVLSGLSSPGSLWESIESKQRGLTARPEASGSSRAKGHIPGPSRMQASRPKPAAPHKGAAEKSQVGKVSDSRLSGNEKLRAGLRGYAGVRT